MSIKNTVMQNIRTMRKQRGLSQAEFAEKVDVSHSHVRQVEAGQSGYSIDMLERVADYFQMEISDLFKNPNDLKVERAIGPRAALEAMAKSFGYDIEIKASPNNFFDSDLALKISTLGEKELELLKRTVDKMIVTPVAKRKAN